MTSKVLKRSLYFIRISHKCQKFPKIESIWPFCWTIGPFIFSNDELLISLLNRDRLNGSKFISSDDSLLLSDIADILELIEFKAFAIFSPLFASFSPLNVSRISSKSISFQDFSTHPVKIDRLMRLINASRVGNISRNQNQHENTRAYFSGYWLNLFLNRFSRTFVKMRRWGLQRDHNWSDPSQWSIIH